MDSMNLKIMPIPFPIFNSLLDSAHSISYSLWPILQTFFLQSYYKTLPLKFKINHWTRVRVIWVQHYEHIWTECRHTRKSLSFGIYQLVFFKLIDIFTNMHPSQVVSYGLCKTLDSSSPKLCQMKFRTDKVIQYWSPPMRHWDCFQLFFGHLESNFKIIFCSVQKDKASSSSNGNDGNDGGVVVIVVLTWPGLVEHCSQKSSFALHTKNISSLLLHVARSYS